jgi:hypothetical protein
MSSSNDVLRTAVAGTILCVALLVGILVLVVVIQSDPSNAFYMETTNVTHAAYNTLRYNDFYYYNHADDSYIVYVVKTDREFNDHPCYNVRFTFNDTQGMRHSASMTMVYGSFGWRVTSDGWGNAQITYERV